MPATVFDKAQVTLPSDREVQVTRSFKAPRALVYRAHTEPDLMRRWMLGPPGWSMTVCEMDVRVGGKYRWRWRNEQDGNEFGFFGEFREVQPPERIVHAEYYDPGTLGGPMPSDRPALVTATFTEEDGVTTLTSIIDFGSKEGRDAALSTGMTDGMEQSYQLLEKLIGSDQV
ncbi:MAG TPA: SRPBCC family protein [Vicinamibacterales bacterium]